MKYANTDQKSRAIITSALSILIGFVTSFHDFWRRMLVYCSATSSYEHIVRKPKTFQITMEFIRLGVRIIAVSSVAVLTTVTCVKYLKLQKQQDDIRIKNSNQEAIRAKLLIKLSIIQSCTLIVGFAPTFVWYFNLYILRPLGADFTNSQALISLKISETVILFPICFTFLFYLLVSRRFRSVFLQTLCSKYDRLS